MSADGESSRVQKLSKDFDLEGVVPAWGRGAEEYEAFFSLTEIPFDFRILDCGAGPSCFTAEWSLKGRFVVAVDPLYKMPGQVIATDFEPTAARMLEGMRKAYHRFKWNYYQSPESVIERRRGVLERFIPDFDASTRIGRYVGARLPDLPFESRSFDLVLCSHMLFLYSEELDAEMHIASLNEMLRVGKEVRVFPLLDMEGHMSRHLEVIVESMRASAQLEFVTVPFEFRYGDSRMLRLKRR